MKHCGSCYKVIIPFIHWKIVKEKDSYYHWKCYFSEPIGKKLRKIQFENYEKQYLKRLEKKPANKCPRCHEENTMTVVRKDGGKLKCEKCNYLCTDDETDVLFGLVKVVESGMASYENMGNNWEKFPSWYCLKFFDSYDERVAHDKKYHQNDTFQLGMVPVGFMLEKPALSCD